MSVEAPRSTRHGGLSDFLNKVQVGVDWINKITSDEATITNPNSTNQQRVDAYNDFVSLYNQSGSFSKTAQGIASNISGLLQTYMQSIVITVANPGDRSSGSPPIPLNYQGHQATLWDIVNAMNSKDGARDFTVSTHLNINPGHYDLNRNVGWLDSNQLEGDIDRTLNSVGECGGSETASNGINWQEGTKSSRSQGADVNAQGTVNQWLPYATASETGGTAGDLAALAAAISNVTH